MVWSLIYEHLGTVKKMQNICLLITDLCKHNLLVSLRQPQPKLTRGANRRIRPPLYDVDKFLNKHSSFLSGHTIGQRAPSQPVLLSWGGFAHRPARPQSR